MSYNYEHDIKNVVDSRRKRLESADKLLLAKTEWIEKEMLKLHSAIDPRRKVFYIGGQQWYDVPTGSRECILGWNNGVIVSSDKSKNFELLSMGKSVGLYNKTRPNNPADYKDCVLSDITRKIVPRNSVNISCGATSAKFTREDLEQLTDCAVKLLGDFESQMLSEEDRLDTATAEDGKARVLISTK